MLNSRWFEFVFEVHRCGRCNISRYLLIFYQLKIVHVISPQLKFSSNIFTGRNVHSKKQLYITLRLDIPLRAERTCDPVITSGCIHVTR